MHNLSPRRAGETTSVGAGGHREPVQPGVVGIALAAVLTFALAQGSWQWFATYIGVTLLVVVLASYRPPTPTPGLRFSYVQDLTAYSLVVGLCVAVALAPMMQRWAWLFPMPGTRSQCDQLGIFESLRTEASLPNLVGPDRTAMAYAQVVHRHDAIADCLASTTTLWLPVYGAGAALLVGLGAWAFGRKENRRKKGAN
ncbi:hypothetical protein [Streptomyces sp. HUAS TT20]|uniref:hypothetical protein n=1 Tax=Streptomyces sp. HUAS TT20 TaxID=3447509 RepID=UPI0021D83E7F|nr:hypothetical protein [Streptomyces sp. HUAS 15-9]UXY28981.1 hypothetical protein N8I87_22115 [Streptomyces sp. HUAS 15-9]